MLQSPPVLLRFYVRGNPAHSAPLRGLANQSAKADFAKLAPILIGGGTKTKRISLTLTDVISDHLIVLITIRLLVLHPCVVARLELPLQL